MKVKFKSAVKNYYESHQLSAQQLNQLQHLQKTSKRQKRSHSPKLLWWPIVATCALAVSLGFRFYPQDNYTIEKQIVNQMSVVQNHNLNPEIYLNSLDGLKEKFPKLGFSPLTSMPLNTSKWQLIGGRYCMLTARMGLCLLMQDKQTKQTLTWFQSPLDPNNQLQQPISTFKDGLSIRVWSEKGIVHGMATSELFEDSTK